MIAKYFSEQRHQITKLAAVLTSNLAHLADLLEILMHYKFVSIIHQKWGKIWKNTNKLLMLAQFKQCQRMYFTDPHLLNLCQAARPKMEWLELCHG